MALDDTACSSAALRGPSIEALRHGRWYGDACGCALTMELVGERWSLLIVRELLLGPRRFNEVRAALPALSAKTLSERLATLEVAGIVRSDRLERANGARGYGLTAWGQELAPVLQAMVRWAQASVIRDGALPMTPVSLMLALVARLRPERIGGLDLWIAFDIAEQRFAGRLLPGGLTIHPGGDALQAPDLRFAARSATDFAPVFFEGAPLGKDGHKLICEGDPQLASRFVALFARKADEAST